MNAGGYILFPFAFKARAEFGGALDILVNNVGMSLRKGTTEYSQEEYARIVDVNFNSVFLLTQVHTRLTVSLELVSRDYTSFSCAKLAQLLQPTLNIVPCRPSCLDVMT